jgi:hypothetical protein
MMTSRRGTVFFWIVQILLLPVPVCFSTTVLMRFHERTLSLWKIGIVSGMVQIPFAAMALIFVIAAGMGELLPKQRLRTMYLELTASALLITLVLYWHGVYRW